MDKKLPTSSLKHWKSSALPNKSRKSNFGAPFWAKKKITISSKQQPKEQRKANYPQKLNPRGQESTK